MNKTATKNNKNKSKKTKHSKFITLVEVTQINKNNSLFDILDNLCFLSKNIYNSALYLIRQSFFDDNSNCLGYNQVNNILVKENNADYYMLPSKVSQQSVKLASQSFSSFFGALKRKKDTKDDVVVHIPRYLDSDTGRQTVFYTDQAVSTKKLKTEGYYTLSKVVDDSGELIKFKTKVSNIQFVRIVHCGNHIRIEVGYRSFKKSPKVTKNIAAIDIGVNNLATLTTNFDSPIIFNGKPLKYINHQYNKLIAKSQSANACCNGVSDNVWTSGMCNISYRRSNKMTDYLHKISRVIVNYLVSNHVSILIVGKNDGWKQNANMGKENNQNFVQIPFARFIDILTYKCSIYGITVVTINESHTSKCSFIDNEPIHHHDKYMGKRKTRDLFKTTDGIVINADVNGSYNIMRRWCESNNCTHYLKFNKYNVCQNPTKITVKLSGKKCNIGEYIK